MIRCSISSGCDERSAQSRLDDILGSETRNTVARHELVELIRTNKDRKAAIDDTLVAGSGSIAVGLPSIKFGRNALEKEIGEQARIKMKEFGIELLDIRFKRINYNPAVSEKIFDRMISERRQIAERFRSEGAGEAARIIGSKERDLRRIQSEAYRKVQVLRGRRMPKRPRSTPPLIIKVLKRGSFPGSPGRWRRLLSRSERTPR